MIKYRFIDTSFDLKEGKKIKIGSERIAHQLNKVLRAREGQNIELCDGALTEAKAEILDIDKKNIKVEINDVYKNQKELQRDVRLFCAVLKKDKFEWVVEKATEIGVREIIPVITERTVKNNLRRDRLQKIALEASEQSGRGIVPKIQEPQNFKRVAESVSKEQNLFFSLGKNKTFESFMPEIDENRPVNIFVGPEGGWSDEEVKKAKERNFEFANLGDLTLRAETAAIIASFLAVK